MGTILFYGGIGLCGVSLIGWIIGNAVVSAKSKKLRKLMDETYGD